MPFLARATNRESVSGESASPLADRTLLAGIIILTALIYLPVLGYEFVYDDQGIIVENALVHSWQFVPDYFQGQLGQNLFPNGAGNYYRPLAILFFRLNHALFGLQPMGWHAYALLLHLLATALVFSIVRRITDRPLIAGVAALLFGLHPTHHEVVAWVSATTESLCAVFFLGAFLAYLRSREHNPIAWMTLSALLYAGGLLSKETAIVLPAVIFAHAYLYGVHRSDTQAASSARRFFQAATRASVYLPVCILYLVVRMHVLHSFSHPHSAFAISTLLLTTPSVLFFYLRQWLFPVFLSEFYDLPLRTSWDSVHVALPLAVLAVAGAALWYFRHKLGSREVVLALVMIAVPLLPAMCFTVFPSGELVHDRYSYLPGLGAALIAGLAFQPLTLRKGRFLFRMPRALVLAMVAIVLPFCYSTANASSYWVNNFVLFENAQRVAPRNVTARNNHAVQLAKQGDTGTALQALQELVKERPDYALANYNLGLLLYDINMLPPAQQYLQQAQKLDPGTPDPDLQLGLICLRTGRLDEAEFHFRRALALRPTDPKFHFVLGVLLAQKKDCVQARASFSEALFLNPEMSKAREQMNKCGTETATEKQRLPVAVGPLSGNPSLFPVRVPLATVEGR